MNTTESEIQRYLVSNKIYPFSVLYISSPGLLKISFHLPTDIQEFLELSGYTKICDNSGYSIFQDTVLMSGVCLHNFLRDVGVS